MLIKIIQKYRQEKPFQFLLNRNDIESIFQLLQELRNNEDVKTMVAKNWLSTFEEIQSTLPRIVESPISHNQCKTNLKQ